MLSYFFLISFVCQIYAKVNIAGKLFSSKQLKSISLLLKSQQLNEKFNIKFNNVKDYIIDLETLKFIFKKQNVQINKDFYKHIKNYLVSIMPDHDIEEIKNLATYITLSSQIKNGFPMPEVEHNILDKIGDDFVDGFILWKISYSTIEEAQKAKKEIESHFYKNSENSQFDIYTKLENSGHLTENKLPILSFQLNSEVFSILKSTIKGNCSEIIFINGKYVFFYVVNRILISQKDYIQIIKENIKNKFLQDQIRMYKKFILEEKI